MFGQIAAFTAAATIVTISPGADMELVARRAITDGWRRASVVSAGVVSGLLVHATASAVGVWAEGCTPSRVAGSSCSGS